MTTSTRAEYARSKGVARSSVTRWEQAGRLILTADGEKIEVEASEARLFETKDPNREDVAARHAANRAKKAIATTPAETRKTPPAPPSAAEDHIGNSYQAARAVKEKYLALTAKATYEQAIAQLLPRQDVEQALADVVAYARAGLENLPSRIAAALVGQDYDVIISTLRQEIIALMEEMHRDAKRHLGQLKEIAK